MSILEEAASLVHGQRNQDYGHPRDDFECQASLFTAYLAKRGILAPGAELSPRDIPMLMCLVKIAREAKKHTRDNLVDLAGYAEACAVVLGESA